MKLLLDIYQQHLAGETFDELTEAEAQILVTLSRSVYERLHKPVKATVTMRHNDLLSSRTLDDAEAYLTKLSSRLVVNVPLAMQMLHSGHTVTVVNEDTNTTFEVKKL